MTVADALVILNAANGRQGDETPTTFVSLRKKRPRPRTPPRRNRQP